MSTPNSSSSYKLQNLVKVLYRYRICIRNNQSREPLSYPAANLPPSNYFFGYAQYFSKSIPTNSGISAAKPMAPTNIENDGIHKVQPSVPPPRKPMFPTWVKWLLGSIMSLVLPFWKLKWGSFLLLEGKVEQVVEEVEIAAEVVEKVANMAEKVSAEVADELPENGKLKEAALIVEHASTVAATDAKLTEDFIHKVEKLKHDLTDLGSMVEPVIDDIIKKEHGEN